MTEDASKTQPRGWSTAALGNITVEKVVQGVPNANAVPYIDISSIDRATKRVGNTRAVDAETAPTRARQWVQVGDVLVSMTRPNLNAVAKVPESLDAAVASTGFDVLRTLEILPEWVYYRVQSNEFITDVCKDLQGVVYPAIRPHDVRRHRLPIPPFSEQCRIVDAIETHLTRLDATVETLKRVQANLKRYRASVLKAAVEGRLVPTEAELAKREGRDYEPASKLIERVLVERRRRWEEAELAKMRAKGKEPKNDKWKAKYKEPVAPETSDLPDLAEGWYWGTLGQLTWLVKDGPHFSPMYSEEGIPFITGGNVRPTGVDFDSAKKISPELHADFSKRIRPEKGDILYTKGGTTGVARVNTYDLEFNVWVHVAVLKLAGIVQPFYVQHALNSPDCYSQAQLYTHGVGNQDLGLTRMIKIVIAIPPLQEQGRIVTEVDRQMSFIAEIEGQIDADLLRCQRLRQSILKWAFEGKIVDQDSNDEPASVLLDRIRAERQTEDKFRKGKKRRHPAHRSQEHTTDKQLKLPV